MKRLGEWINYAEIPDCIESSNSGESAGYFYIAGCNLTIYESQVDHRGPPTQQPKRSHELTIMLLGNQPWRCERRGNDMDERCRQILETPSVKLGCRWMGLVLMATLLAGSAAAQGLPLPDPDGLELPEGSILGPGFDDELPPVSAPSRMAPIVEAGPMEPSRLVGEHVMHVPYDETEPQGDYGPDGDPWQQWGPQAQPFSPWGAPAVPESSGTWLDRGVWYAEADAVIFARVWKGSDILMTADDQVVTNPLFSNISQLNTNRYILLSNSNPGKDVAVRTTLGRFLFRDDHNRDHTAEFTALGGGDWVQDLSITSSLPNGLFIPFRISGALGDNRDFSGSSFQRVIYTSRLNSFELNYRVKQRLGRDQMVMDPNGCWRRMANNGWNRNFLAGLRYLGVHEMLDWRAEDIASVGTDGRYLIRTRNDLFGVQFGGGIHYETGRWSLGVNGKLGLLVNDADARSQLDFTDTDDEDFNRFATEDEMSFLMESSLLGRWHITPNCSLRCSLDLLYFESVALAPDQANFIPVYTKITTTGDPFYLGGGLGFECYW